MKHRKHFAGLAAVSLGLFMMLLPGCGSSAADGVTRRPEPSVPESTSRATEAEIANTSGLEVTSATTRSEILTEATQAQTPETSAAASESEAETAAESSSALADTAPSAQATDEEQILETLSDYYSLFFSAFADHHLITEPDCLDLSQVQMQNVVIYLNNHALYFLLQSRQPVTPIYLNHQPEITLTETVISGDEAAVKAEVAVNDLGKEDDVLPPGVRIGSHEFRLRRVEGKWKVSFWNTENDKDMQKLSTDTLLKSWTEKEIVDWMAENEETETNENGWIQKPEGWKVLYATSNRRYVVASWYLNPEAEDGLLGYGLAEISSTGLIRLLDTDFGLLSPFYTLRVVYSEKQTFVWGLTKTTGIAGPDMKKITVDPYAAVLKADGETKSLKLQNSAYLFVLNEVIQPDELMFYNPEGAEQGGTKYPDMGITFDQYPAP